MKPYPPLAQLGPRAISLWGIRTQTERVRVEGIEHIPATGPVLLVARHFHHLLDGSVLVTRVRRPIHIVVGLDWAATPFIRRWMERVCRAAQYPIVLRAPTLAASGAYRRDELVAYTRAAFEQTTRLLRAGRVVLVFPEGYPTIDPSGSRKPDRDAWLPFAAGPLRMLERAECDGRTKVALVPVGFSYEQRTRWSITARVGTPLEGSARNLSALEAAVKRLSGLAPAATVGRRDEDVVHY